MGNYIVHKRRKIRDPVPDRCASGAGQSDSLDRKLTQRREAERLEGERRQAAKMARALGRRAERRSTVVDWTSGRRHTAARVAGIVIISAVDLHFNVGLEAFEPIFSTSIETFVGRVSIGRVRQSVRFLG